MQSLAVALRSHSVPLDKSLAVALRSHSVQRAFSQGFFSGLWVNWMSIFTFQKWAEWQLELQPETSPILNATLSVSDYGGFYPQWAGPLQNLPLMLSGRKPWTSVKSMTCQKKTFGSSQVKKICVVLHDFLFKKHCMGTICIFLGVGSKMFLNTMTVQMLLLINDSADAVAN